MNPLKYFDIHETTCDGNCLFDAISKALTAHLRNDRYSSNVLRGYVAASILDRSNEKVVKILKVWYDIFQSIVNDPSPDYSILVEYRYLEPCRGKPWPLDDVTLYQIYKLMLDKNMYWGEEYALRILEKIIGVRFFIVESIPTKGILIHNSLDHESQHNVSYAIWLYLSSKHYRLLSLKGKYIFQPSDFQGQIGHFLKEASANGGWVLKF